MDLNIGRQNQLFSIKQLSQKLNIPKSTLRFWEREFEGFIVAERTEGGQRRYNFDHIAKFEVIKKLREKEMNLREINIELKNKSYEDSINFKKIDQLAERLAKIVKDEVYNFFK